MGKPLPLRKSLAGSPEIDVILRRSLRARRITLRVSTLDGRVTLTVPRGASEAEALAFAASRAEWIRAQLGRRTPTVDVGPGTILPVDGAPHRVVLGPRTGLGDGEISVRPGRPAGQQVVGCLKELARLRLSGAVDRHAAALGRRANRMTLRDTRSRWGSCSSDGNLMFSWRLIMAPPEVLDYVAAHEVAHLVRMDHSPGFWEGVAALMPDYPRHRAWLRRNGAALHAWRFAD